MSEYKLPAPSSGKAACDCIRFTFSGQGERSKRWQFEMNHVRHQVVAEICPRILWTTLWETHPRRPEVLDFQDFLALHAEPARVTLSQ